MSHDSLVEAPQTQEGPTSFNFDMDAAYTDGMPDDERPGECDDETTSGDALQEDSTFALIFKSPVKGKSAPLSTSPAKVESSAPLSGESEQATTICKASEAISCLHLSPSLLWSRRVGGVCLQVFAQANIAAAIHAWSPHAKPATIPPIQERHSLRTPA